jgi:RND family efflux transporter MFP subunit
MTMRAMPTLAVVLVFVAHRASAIDSSPDFDCLLQPHAVADVSTRELGVLEALLVGRGDRVKAGQPIAKLESGVEEIAVQLMRARVRNDAEIEEARANLGFAKRRLERITELFEKQAMPFDEQDRASTEAATAELRLKQVLHDQAVMRLELERAERQLALRTIRSPLDGVVVERLLEVGESVEDRPIMRIAAVDPLNVEMIVPVEYHGSIALGAHALVSPRLPTAGEVSATVVVVDPIVDAASNTFGVRLEMPNPEHSVPGGVRCDVRFVERITQTTTE